MIRQRELKIKVEASELAVSGFGGLSTVVQVAQHSGMLAQLAEGLRGLKRRKRGYCPSTAVLDLMLLLCAGGECIDDLKVLRADAGLQRLLRRTVVAPSTAHEFLRRIGQAELDALAEVRRHELAVVAKQSQEDTATIDADASLFVSGVREAQMSYTGERGWMPMLAFWAERDMVVHEEFRQGNEAPGSGALEFLKATVAQLPRAIKHIDVRSDSAWYIAEILDYCQDQGYGFSITADKDVAVQALLAAVREEDWQEINVPADPADTEGYLRQWACETVHTLNDSKHAFRLILLRRERAQADLFAGKYIYGAIITNKEKPLKAQLIWHRERCNCENHIKELKHGLGLKVLPSGSFAVNAAYFRIATLAYNLIALLKHLSLPQSWRYCTLKTLRFRLLALPAVIVRHARQLIMRVARGHPQLAVLRSLLT